MVIAPERKAHDITNLKTGEISRFLKSNLLNPALHNQQVHGAFGLYTQDLELA